MRGRLGTPSRKGACVRPRPICSHEGRTDPVLNGDLCMRHEAKCSRDGCSVPVWSVGLCYRHLPCQIICSHEGCSNPVPNRGLCITHRHTSSFRASPLVSSGASEESTREEEGRLQCHTSAGTGIFASNVTRTRVLTRRRTRCS